MSVALLVILASLPAALRADDSETGTLARSDVLAGVWDRVDRPLSQNRVAASTEAAHRGRYGFRVADQTASNPAFSGPNFPSERPLSRGRTVGALRFDWPIGICYVKIGFTAAPGGAPFRESDRGEQL